MKNQKKQTLRKWIARVGSFVPALIAGCVTTGACNVDNCSTIPPGAIPAPNGTYVCKFQQLQAAKAEADDFVVYKHEWYMGGKELGPYGLYHISQMVKRLPHVPFPVLIQVTTDAELNEARRQVIVGFLTQNGIIDGEARVILGFPEAEGLYGEEAELIFYQMLYSRYYNGFGGGGGIGRGGFGGGGFGGGGFGGGGFGGGGFGRGFGGFGGGYGGYGGGYGGYGGNYGGLNMRSLYGF